MSGINHNRLAAVLGSSVVEPIAKVEQKKTLVYLATPYSHPDRSVMQHRFEVVNKVAARLIQQGLHIFSPISHTHPIAVIGELPRGWDFWEAYDRAILRACCKVIVLQQDGWQESRGVSAEVSIALELGIPVEYIPVD